MGCSRHTEKYFLSSRGRPTATLVFFLAALLLSGSPLRGGTTGKVVGQVIDPQSREPLPGAQVRIDGTAFGVLTDNEGQYFLLSVPPGIYSVTTSLIGHRTVTKQDVEAIVDGTTRIDFELETAVIEMPAMTVTAERPLLRKDVTSSIKVVSEKKIGTMPVNRLDEILKIQPGFVVDASNELHVRGGRTGEIAYYIDGIPVENSLYGGLNSLLNDDIINQLLILSGTFSAEYGDALSGVVNVVTKEGEDAFHGHVEYKSPMMNDSPYRKRDWAGEGIDSQRDPVSNMSDYMEPDIFDSNVRLPVPGILSASVGGPVAGLDNLSFFLAGRSDKQNSYLPFGYHLEEDMSWKLAYNPWKGAKLTLLGQNSKNNVQNYNHAWKYVPENMSVNSKSSDRIGATWRQNLGDNVFYSIVASRESQHSNVGVGNLSPQQYLEGERIRVMFYSRGDDDLYRRSRITTSLGKTDLTWQRGKRHELKFGGEFKYHDISLLEYNDPWLGLKESYRKHPVEGAVYLQDKLEYDFFILNAGLRFDFVDPRAKMWKDLEDPESPLVDVPIKSQFSPRIGLSHPVTDKSIIYFSYGHFFQNPEYDLFYSNSRNLVPENMIEFKSGSVGNRDIRPKKTVAYEVGVKQELTEDLGLGVTAFFKDINNMIGMKEVQVTTEQGPYHYFYFTNIDFANVKGVELTLDRRYNHHLAWDLNYTYAIAMGNFSFPRQIFFDVTNGKEEENQDYFLDFDRRHVVSADVTLNTEKWKGPRVSGFHPLANSGLSAIVQYASGLPYTPWDPSTNTLGETNSARRPWTGTVDVNLHKNILTGAIQQSLFVEITNLLDRRNILWVDTSTGALWDTSSSGPEAVDFAFDPGDVGAPRIIRIGTRFSF